MLSIKLPQEIDLIQLMPFEMAFRLLLNLKMFYYIPSIRQSHRESALKHKRLFVKVPHRKAAPGKTGI